MEQTVGIVTMVGSDNYGNSLQNYAVQTLVEQAGYNAITLLDKTTLGFFSPLRKEQTFLTKLKLSYIYAFICLQLGKYLGSKNDRDFSLFNLLAAKRNTVYFNRVKNQRHTAFEKFRHEMIHLDDTEIDNKWFDKKHYNQYYAFICGSDQVWGPHYKTTSMVSFLQFAPQYKRIAFAPSFGASQIPESRHDDFARWISEIPSLSVREEDGARIIRDLTGRVAQVLLDPTFGLASSQWHDFARPPQKMPKRPYAFCYFLGNMCSKYERWIEKKAIENGWGVISTWDIQCLDYYDIDPREFVWLIENAQAVFTDSFHGMALAINLQRPFVVFERNERGTSMSSRISSLLKITGLENRKFPLSNTEVFTNIDYSKAKKIIDSERLKIITYLKESLERVRASKYLPLLANKYHCTGCGVCVNACPVAALEMKPDNEGFLYPKLDTNKCISCHRCEKACPADNHQVEKKEPYPISFWAYSKSTETCQNSSSGGIFTLLAEEILKQGGVVFGVSYDSNFNVVHRKIDRIEDISQLRTSKYVQSETNSVYNQVLNDLKSGRQVLFTGTPCQVTALKSYLGEDYPNLFTQDIICHGVPSPGVWHKYLEQIHFSSGKKITSISFRDKTEGWNNFSMKVQYDDGSSYRELAIKDPFECAFLANLILRPACHQCQYKTLQRCSDVTLADYWGVEIIHPELKNQQGVSLVLLQTEKGKRLFDVISQNCYYGETSCQIAISMNRGYMNSAPMHPKRLIFFEAWPTSNLKKLVTDCLKQSLISICKRKIIRTGAIVKKGLRTLHIISTR